MARLRHVEQGQPLRPSASDWNAAMDTVRRFHQPGRGGTLRPPSGRKGDLVSIRNDSTDGSGDDAGRRARFDVLGIDDVLAPPSQEYETWASDGVLTGSVPTADAHTGKFVILVDGCDEGEVVRAMASGVINARINVLDEDHAYADVKDGDATQLESAEFGAAYILWKESGTGTKRAIVRLGVPGGPFDVVQCDSCCMIDEADGDGNHVNTATMTNHATGDEQNLLIHFARPVTLTNVSRLYVAVQWDCTWWWKERAGVAHPPAINGYGSTYSQAALNVGLILREFDTATETWNTFDPDTTEDTDWVLWRECKRMLHGQNGVYTLAIPALCLWPILKTTELLSLGPARNGGHSDPAGKVYGVILKPRDIGEWMPDAPDSTGDAEFDSADIVNAVNLSASCVVLRGCPTWTPD